MKKTIIIALHLLSISHFCCAQENDTAIDREVLPAYISIGVGAGSGFRFQTCAHFFINNKYSLIAGYFMDQQKAKNIPSDFSQGDFLNFNPIAGPLYQNDMVGIGCGRTINWGTQHNFRLNLNVLLLYGNFKSPKFEKSNAATIVFFVNYYENYKYDYVKKETFGISLMPSFEIIRHLGFGFSFNGYLKINQYNTDFGFGVNMIFGKLRMKK